MTSPTLVRTALATAAAAAVGTVAADPGTDWYRSLDKPPWQPPKAAFPVVWTALYASIAGATARALDHGPAGERHRLWGAYAVNLTLNAAWPPLFFRARRPRVALAEIVALDAANVALVARVWRSDRLAGAVLLPYLAWTGFATGLNASIAARNHDRCSRPDAASARRSRRSRAVHGAAR